MDEQELLRRIAENQASGLGPHPGREAPNPALQGGVLGQFMPPREDHTDEAKTALQAVLMSLPTPAIGGILGKLLGKAGNRLWQRSALRTADKAADIAAAERRASIAAWEAQQAQRAAAAKSAQPGILDALRRADQATGFRP
jgi:hypothetical protein